MNKKIIISALIKKCQLIIPLLLITLFFFFKGGMWIYNNITCGKFIKIGEKHIDDIRYSSLYETDYASIQFFIPSNPYINDSPVENAFEKLDNFLVFYSLGVQKKIEIYNKNNDFVFYKKVNNALFYNLDEKEKALKIIRNTNQYSLNTQPIIKYLSNSKNKILSTGSDNIKNIKLSNTDNIEKIIALDNKNLLLIFGKSSYRYSTTDNKLHKLDTSEISYLSGTYNNLIQLKDNKFLYIQNEKISGKLFNVALYILENDKFMKKDLRIPDNINKIAFSTDNPLVLSENQILFVGGAKGYLSFKKPTKQCYLYDIQKNKLIKVNDFPFCLNKIRILKTKSGDFYLPVMYENNGHIKHFIYKYEKQRKL